MRNRNRWFRRTYGIGRGQLLAFGGIDQFGKPIMSQGDKPGSGPSGSCVCPSCGAKVAHVTGKACNETSCPECGTTMTRE